MTYFELHDADVEPWERTAAEYGARAAEYVLGVPAVRIRYFVGEGDPRTLGIRSAGLERFTQQKFITGVARRDQHGEIRVRVGRIALERRTACEIARTAAHEVMHIQQYRTRGLTAAVERDAYEFGEYIAGNLGMPDA